MIRKDAERLVDLLARSKAVWMVPELLNLAVEAENPSKASQAVLAHPDGTRRKAKAANLLAIAYRDFPDHTVGACVRFAQVCCAEGSGLKLRRIADLLTPED